MSNKEIRLEMENAMLKLEVASWKQCVEDLLIRTDVQVSNGSIGLPKYRPCKSVRGGRGRRPGNRAAFTADDIRKIRTMYARPDHNTRTLSEIYNCHPGSISAIVRGVTYNWVEDEIDGENAEAVT